MLTGPNLLLRAPELQDVDILFRWENNTDIWHLGNTLAPYSRFAIEQYVLNTDHDIFTNKQLRLMIDWHTSPEGSVTIGSLDMFDFDPHHRRAGVGILIEDSARRKGFASEALQLLIEYCFDLLNLHQLYCSIEHDNKESIGLFTKAGFEACGKRRDWFFRNESWKDELLFQFLKPSATKQE